MLESFQNVFEPGGEATNILEHHINTGNSPPISVPPYRMSPVKNCPDCIKYKASNQKPSRLLQTPVPAQRFESLDIDLFGPLPESKDGKRWILIIEDCTTKWVELLALPNATAKECAITLIEEVSTKLCITSAEQRCATKKGETNATQRRSLRDFNTKISSSSSSYEIASLDNPGAPLGVYHTSALTPCNNDKVKPLIPLRKRGRPPKVPQTPDSSSGPEGEDVTNVEISRVPEPASHSFVVLFSRTGNVVSCSSRTWNRFLETGSVGRRPGQGCRRATTSNEDRYLVLTAQRHRNMNATLLQQHLRTATGTTVSTQTVRNRLHGVSLYAHRSMHIFIWRERGSRNNPASVHENVRFSGEGVLVYGGISTDGRTDLYIIRDGPLTARRYRDEILRHIVVPYAAAIGDDFILMDDNCRPHRANLVEDLLFEEGIVRMEWPACSPDMNPIENVWNTLGIRVAGRQPPPQTLQELERALLEEWDRIPQLMINSLIDSMPQRCSTLLAVQGNHTPY
ncbi:transposable element Tcb2 transposase [Trichonephila clavipes]|nr:transposable element Tcb2 transposase [Trichonephila clavipes]